MRDSRRREPRKKKSGWLEIAICCVVISANLIDTAACRLCNYGPDSVPDPNREIGEVSIAPSNTTCGQIEELAKSAPEGTHSCFQFRSVARLCGCTIPPNACHLCWDGSAPSHRLPNDIRNESAVSSDHMMSATTCSNIDNRIHAIDKGDPRCNLIHQDFGERCGCPPHPENNELDNNQINNTTTENDNIFAKDANSTTELDGRAPWEETCTLCFDGQPTPYKDKIFQIDQLNMSISCEGMDSFASVLYVGTTSCTELQSMGLYCGCAPRPGACTLCPNGESVPYKDQTLDGTFVGAIPEAFRFFESMSEAYSIYTLIPGITLTCAVMEMVLNSAAMSGIDDVLCWSNQMTSSICGCSPLTYAVVLTWVYRISGSLSFLCSVLIIVRILSKPMRRRFTVYHQLVLGVSFFDLVGSTAYILAGAMNPVESGVYQAMGNQATCKIQGVLVQLGLTSMFYNTCLATYFFLVVNHNWKEHQFKKLQFWVHLVVISGGLALAFASIPWVGPYSRLTGICAHQKPPSVPSDLPLTLLLTVPMSIVLVTITVTTVWICVKVFVREVKANKWRSERRMGMTKAVFWQSFWYVAAFVVSQPILLVQNYRAFSSRTEGEAMLIISAVLAPSQGILNSFIYFQRSCTSSRKKRTRGAKKAKILPWIRQWHWKRGKSSSTNITREMTTPPRAGDSFSMQQQEAVAGGESSRDEYGDTAAAARIVDNGHYSLPRKSSVFEDDHDDNDNNDCWEDEEDDAPDILSAFEAVAEYWALNEVNDDSMSGRVSRDDDDHYGEPPRRNGKFRRPFRSFRLNGFHAPAAASSQSTSLPLQEHHGG